MNILGLICIAMYLNKCIFLLSLSADEEKNAPFFLLIHIHGWICQRQINGCLMHLFLLKTIPMPV